MRKLAAVSIAIIVAGGVMIASPATAAAKISNGTACTKSGATTSVSGSKYKCATNPLSTSKKLTWLSLDCITTANAYVAALKSSSEISTKLAAQIPVIDLGIANEITNKAETQVKLDESNLRLTAAQTKLAAAKSDADKKILTTAIGSWTSAVRAYTSKMNRIAQTIKTLEASKLKATNQPIQLTADVANTKSNAQLICTKGF